MPADLIAIVTGATCGEACWSAREDVCRCSCGGINHGCRRAEGGQQPARTAKIRGHVYELVATGTYPAMEQEKREIEKRCKARGVGVKTNLGGGYISLGLDNDPGYPVIRKAATDAQIANWPELAAARGINVETGLAWRPHQWNCPRHLLWVRADYLPELGE